MYRLPAGTYSVAEDAARGYVGTISGACAADGTVILADGDDKTCTVTNRDGPLGAGLVIESYGPTRTDSEWGLTESFLTETRGYLEDPANFGPSGTVARSLQVAPGIRVASARTLAGVDVFFTGWVPTDSYTDAEKAALRDFVLGGGTLIATTDDSGHTMVDEFGLVQGDGAGNPTENTITDTAHPIASGPFGAVTSFNQYHATGHYPSLGPNAHEVGRNDAATTLAVVERGKLASGSGAAIFVADVDVFSNAGFGGASVNATLIKNVFAFATAGGNEPTLRVITNVINNDGGAAVASDFSVHVRRDGAEVSGSPAPGLPGPNGRLYTLQPATYVVSADGMAGYATSLSGGCDAAGSVTLVLDRDATCTVTVDDIAPKLRVITNVVNDNGGTASAANVSAHVRRNGTEVTGSPQPGAGGPDGTLYTLEPGAYVVSGDGVAGYEVTITGACAGDGSVMLVLGQDATCTITADDVAPRLTVIMQVVNDHGGSAAPSGFTVHVRKGGSDVAGSPQPGSGSGTTYTLTGGAHVVSADAVSGYGSVISGDCAGDGSITLSAGDTRACTITADDNAPPVGAAQELPPPVAGKKVNAVPKSGTVKVKLPGTNKFVELQEGQQVPLGTTLDTRKGRVTLVAASDKSGGTATADFFDGIFKVGQTKGAKPITTLDLVEKLSCPRGRATAAAKRKKRRRLWGDGSGRFRTSGEYSSATVRGTRWLVEDRCDSTLTKVTRGKVEVRDLVKRKTVIVKAGKQYVAKRRH